MSATPADITTRPLSLVTLLEGIDDGRVVLPDFQRDFDWNTGEVVSLVATLLCGWPAGSLLLMKGRPEFFATRPFEYAPRQAAAIDYVVLDGQQRLTALYLALRGQGPEIFVLHYDDSLFGDAALSAEQVEELITTVPRDEWEEKFTYRAQAEQRLVPLTALSSASDFFEWRDQVVEASATAARETTSDRLSRLYRVLLGTINHYDFPCVVLENNLPSEAVARIFERINRSGRRLNTFDLLVARAYAPDWNLRDQWESACREFENLDAFLGDDGLPVLQLIALHDLEDVRQPALLGLSPARVREAWDHAVLAMDQAIEAVKSFGCLRADWLPYKAQLLTLGGIAWDGDLGSAHRLLEVWFWGSALGSTYDVGSSTKVTADVRSLRSAIAGSANLERPFVGFDSLVAATRRRNPALWRTCMALLTRAGGVDLLSGDDLDTDASAHSVSVSLFPTSRGPGESVHLRVFSQVKATRETAKSSRASSLLRLLGTRDLPPELPERQFLPEAQALQALASDPQQLLTVRVEAIIDYLRSELDDDIVGLQRSIQITDTFRLSD